MRLEVGRSVSDPHLASLHFHREARKTYSIWFRDGLGAGSWQLWKTVPASANPEDIELTEPITGISRFYRLTSP